MRNVHVLPRPRGASGERLEPCFIEQAACRLLADGRISVGAWRLQSQHRRVAEGGVVALSAAGLFHSRRALPVDSRWRAPGRGGVAVRPLLASVGGALRPSLVAVTLVEPILSQGGPAALNAQTWCFSADAWSSDAPALLAGLVSKRRVADAGDRVAERAGFRAALTGGATFAFARGADCDVDDWLAAFVAFAEATDPSLRPWVSLGAGFDELCQSYVAQGFAGDIDARAPVFAVEARAFDSDAFELSSAPKLAGSARSARSSLTWSVEKPGVGCALRDALARAHGRERALPAVSAGVLADVSESLNAAPMLAPETVLAWARDPERRLSARLATHRSAAARACMARSCLVAWVMRRNGRGPSLHELVDRLAPSARPDLADAEAPVAPHVVCDALMMLTRDASVLGDAATLTAIARLSALSSGFDVLAERAAQRGESRRTALRAVAER